MNIELAKKVVIQSIEATLGNKINVTESMQLIGGESALDSMKLVELCITLEDIADDNGFEFDWTSEAAMSKSRSMFRTVLSLSEEFSKQSEISR